MAVPDLTYAQIREELENWQAKSLPIFRAYGEPFVDELYDFLDEEQVLSEEDTPDLLKLYIILEQRNLLNTFSTRNLSIQSMFEVNYKNNSSEMHRKLKEGVETHWCKEPKVLSCIDKILHYAYLSHISPNDIYEFLKDKLEDPDSLMLLTDHIEHLFHQNKLNRDALFNISLESLCETHQLGLKVYAQSKGRAFWQFATLADCDKGIISEETKARFQQFADWGYLADNGILSNKLINIFGRRNLTSKYYNAKRGKSQSDFEQYDFVLNQRMIKIIRELQELDLLLNQENYIATEVQEKIERIKIQITEAKNCKTFAEDPKFLQKINQKIEQSLGHIERQLHDFQTQTTYSHDDILDLQQTVFRTLVQGYQKAQGILGIRNGHLLENESNSHTTQDAFYAIQDYYMSRGIRITRAMLNQEPKKGEALIPLGEMHQPEHALFAALQVDHPTEEDSELYLQHQQWVLDIKKTDYDQSIRDPKQKLEPVETNTFSTIVVDEQDLKCLKNQLRRQVPIQRELSPLDRLLQRAYTPRTTVEPYFSDDFFSAATEFCTSFIGYFEKLSAERPFIFATSFSLPYIQFGFTGLWMLGHGGNFATYLHALSIKVSAFEAGLLQKLHIPIAAHDIQKIIELIDSKIIHYNGVEGAIEALINTGFIPAKLVFVFSDYMLNGFLGSEEGMTWITQMKEHHGAMNIESKVGSEELEEGLRDLLRLSLQLGLSTIAGMGVHQMLLADSKILNLIASPIGALMNVNPLIFEGPIFSNMLQKVLTTQKAAIIFAKISMIDQNLRANDSEHSVFMQAQASLAQQEALKQLQAISVFLSEKGLDIMSMDADQILVEMQQYQTHLATQYDYPEYSEIKQTDADFMSFCDEIAERSARATPNVKAKLTAFMMASDQARLIAYPPKPTWANVKQKAIVDDIIHKRVRDPWRRVVTFNSADHKVLSYFIDLLDTHYIPSTNDVSFISAKLHFEALLFETPDLWKHFSDNDSIHRLQELGVRRRVYSPAMRVLRFMVNDVLIRYGFGSICAPFTALYVVIAGKDKVPWPLRQFLGTTLFPALYKGIGNIVQGIVFGVLFLLTLGQVGKSGLKPLSIVGQIVIELLRVLQKTAKAVLKSFVEVLSRLPEILVGVVTDPIYCLTIQLPYKLVGGAMTLVGLVLAIPIAGILKATGSTESYSDLVKKPYDWFKKGMAAIDVFALKNPLGPIPDEMRFNILESIRDVRYDIRNGVGFILRKMNDWTYRAARRKIQEVNVLERGNLVESSTLKMVATLGGKASAEVECESDTFTTELSPVTMSPLTSSREERQNEVWERRPQSLGAQAC